MSLQWLYKNAPSPPDQILVIPGNWITQDSGYPGTQSRHILNPRHGKYFDVLTPPCMETTWRSSCYSHCHNSPQIGFKILFHIKRYVTHVILKFNIKFMTFLVFHEPLQWPIFAFHEPDPEGRQWRRLRRNIHNAYQSWCWYLWSGIGETTREIIWGRHRIIFDGGRTVGSRTKGKVWRLLN